jgi:hypothetical protein
MEFLKRLESLEAPKWSTVVMSLAAPDGRLKCAARVSLGH